MKCLSLWQPWASLLVHGRKRVETRSWPISHRGPLLIHAAKKWDGELSAMCVREPFKGSLECMGIFHDNPFTKPHGLHFGCIVGRVDVRDCLATERVGRWEQTPGEPDVHACLDNFGLMGLGDGKPFLFVSDQERAFGDYSPGRFTFFCSDFCAFEKPIPCVGRQGLFNVPDSLIKAA